MIKKKYLIRHSILKALYQDYLTGDPNDYIQDKATTGRRISDLSGLSNEEIYSQTDYLLSVNEIKALEIDYSDLYYITNKGRIAYHDNKYIEEGKSHIFKSFKEWITLCSIIVAIMISVFTFISNYLETKKNSTAIEEINTQLRKLQPQTKK